jgi:hypothetical protein
VQRSDVFFARAKVDRAAVSVTREADAGQRRDRGSVVLDVDIELGEIVRRRRRDQVACVVRRDREEQVVSIQLDDEDVLRGLPRVRRLEPRNELRNAPATDAASAPPGTSIRPQVKEGVDSEIDSVRSVRSSARETELACPNVTIELVPKKIRAVGGPYAIL